MVKARGDGLAFDLRKADFRIHRPSSVHDLTTATLYTDGVEASRWVSWMRISGDGGSVQNDRADQASSSQTCCQTTSLGFCS